MSRCGRNAVNAPPQKRGTSHSPSDNTMTYLALPSSTPPSTRTLFRIVAEFGRIRVGAIVVDHHHTIRTDAAIEIRRHGTSPLRTSCP